MVGAKCKLTQPLCDAFCEAIENGDSILGACGHVGITERTYYNWYNKGKEAKSGKFKEFVEAVEIAKSKAVHNFERVIVREADNGTWTAAAWWLERRHPELYSKRDTHQVDMSAKVKSENIVKLERSLNKLDDDDY